MVSFTTPILVLLTLFTSVTYSYTYVGCYAPPTDLEFNIRFIFQSVGYCRVRCSTLHQPVLGVTNGTDCLCGSVIPLPGSLVEDSLCNSPCSGYAAQMCGGRGFFSVYLIADLDNPERPPNETATQRVEPGSTSIALPQASIDNKSAHLSLPDSDEL